MDTTFNQNYETEKNHINWNIKTILTLIICITIPILVGAISSHLTKDAMITFNAMNKPPLSPPAWAFPIVWTILYILMGGASFLIYKSNDESRYMGLVLYTVQLIFNFFWSIIFFRLASYEFAAVWLALMIVMIISLIINSAKYSLTAMLMLIPYVAWCGFALYLNIRIAMLN